MADGGAMNFNEERKSALEAAFRAQAAEGLLELRPVYDLVFTKEESSEYSYSSFEEDLFATNPEVKRRHSMSWEDVLKFLDDNC